MDYRIAVIGELGKSTTCDMIKSACRSETPAISEMNSDDILSKNEFYNNDVYLFLNPYSSLEVNDGIKQLIKGVSHGKTFVVNSDERRILDVMSENNIVPVITFGLNGKSTITASSLSCTRKNTKFTYCLQRNIATLAGRVVEPFEYPFEVKAVGAFQVYNALAAITALILIGRKVKDIKESLRSFVAKHSMEVVYDDKFTVIDNRSSGLKCLDSVFESLQFIEYNRLLVVCQLSDDYASNRRVRDCVLNWFHILNMKKAVYVLNSGIGKNLKDLNSGDEVYFSNFVDSIRYAVDNAMENDVVLLIGDRVKPERKEEIFAALYS
ncbi:Mur ligase family protein [Caldanaerobius polysaccharolyticus]|uniref:Mur ligase family protein n=1 Tax=Caldanaerobius polysaccharolyticus TaxID=44256 RepID=UPI00146FBD2D|nr:Mur ligase family protein [Caldanaerobius polysaccharolyticus]